MAKQNFKQAATRVLNDPIETLLGETQAPEATEKRPVGRPKSYGYTRTSVIINDEQLAKIRYISGTENVSQKDIIELALHNIIEKFEKKHGTIEVKVQTKRRNIKELF